MIVLVVGPPNHALQRTRPVRSGCNPRVPRAGSLSLGRYPNQLKRSSPLQHNNWQCPKCQDSEFEEGQIATTGGGLSKFFNVQNKKFATVTCTRCK